MNARPARLLAASTSLLLVAGLGTVTSPAQAATARATTTTVAAAKPLTGRKVTLAATVSPKAGGTVRFAVAGKVLAGCSARPLSSGRATCVATFTKPGTITVAAGYSGRASTYKASRGTRTVTVSVAPSAAAAGTVVGGTGSCTTAKGALVAVGFGAWNGPIVRGCDTTPTKGSELLTTAGFSIAQVQRQPGFVCRLGHPLFDSGTQYPKAAQDACVNTPPADDYWSYWIAAKGSNTWKYATLGAYSQAAVNGEVQAWTHGSTDVDGTTGQPGFTPNQIRAGLPTAAAAPQQRRAAVAKPAARADQAAAVRYLTDDLVDGTHHEPFGQPDHGLTIDTALALAATGSADSTLAKITTYEAKHQNDYTLLSGPDAKFVSGGAVAKVALLAEVTGHDPRDFGGVDLVAALDRLTCTQADVTADTGKGPADGSLCTAVGNYRGADSVFAQSLGVIAQQRAGADVAPALDFLTGLQLDSGAFPSVLPAAGSAAEVDSTALAAQALDVAGERAAADRALSWIAGRQRADGGFPGAAGNSTNSAALAILGLTLGGSRYGDELDRAQAFLAGQQNRDGGFVVTADDGNGSDVRATAQVLSALVGTPLGTLVDDVATPRDRQPNADAGAGYLVDQLVDGDHLPASGGYENYGGTADVALALAAAGSRDDTLVDVLKYLRAHVADYADPKGTGKYPGPYGGQVAKLALIAESTGQDPTDFGGFDLIDTLTKTLCTGPDTTNFTCAAKGDFYQIYATTSQALGVLALARAGVTVPADAVDRLLQLQCTGGGFSSDLIGPDDECTPDVDTTGIAIQALVLLKSTAARDAVSAGVTYLRKAQADNGSWQGGTVPAESTNSTALAIQGLLAAPASADFPSGGVRALATRADPAVRTGLAYLGSRQNGDGGFDISTAAAGSDVRATSQVVPAAAFVTYTSLDHPVSLDDAPAGGGTSSATPSAPGGSVPADGTASPVAGGAAAGGTGGTADTGVPSLQLVGYALALLLGGGLLLALGRRRQTAALVAAVVGRHRAGHR